MEKRKKVIVVKIIIALIMTLIVLLISGVPLTGIRERDSFSPILKEEICGTWRGDEQTFIFGEDNSYTNIKLNEIIRGSYEIKEDRISIYYDNKETFIGAEIIEDNLAHILFPLSEQTRNPIKKLVVSGGSIAVIVERTEECGEEVNGS